MVPTYVTWKRKRVRGSGSVWKRRSGIFKKIRKRIRVGSNILEALWKRDSVSFHKIPIPIPVPKREADVR
ncbi:hypothetical protein YC2023_032307 [Brassica napus]